MSNWKLVLMVGLLAGCGEPAREWPEPPDGGDPNAATTRPSPRADAGGDATDPDAGVDSGPDVVGTDATADADAGQVAAEDAATCGLDPPRDTECGRIGYTCCATGAVCNDAVLSCRCGVCATAACGAAGQSCCAGARCNAGATCSTGRTPICVLCGGRGQSCCPAPAQACHSGPYCPDGGIC
jgi:hypothetical protein